MTFLGPYLAACAVLALAGAAKVRTPGDTANALRVSRRVVRAGAACEVAIGVVGFVTTIAAPAVAASYVAFAVYVALLLRRGGRLATCGCFGEPDTPATRTHVALNASFAVAALAVSGSGATMRDAGPALLLAAAVITGLAFVLLVELPAVVAIRRELVR